MWVVKFALRQRYTIGALVLLLLLIGGRSMQQVSIDVLPSIDIPYVNVMWTYPGLSAKDMAAKISSFSEIAIMNNVDDVKQISSENGNGFSLIRVEFHPDAKLEMALTQITGVSQTILKRLPSGMTPPLVVNYTTSSVPILQLALSSSNMTQSQLYDYARLSLRRQIQSIPGLRLSLPFGGAPRQLMIDIDPLRLQAYGVTAQDVAQAIHQQNVTLPSGVLRQGKLEFTVSTNASPSDESEFADIPVKYTKSGLIQLRDVAQIRDGGAVATSMARVDGQAGVIVSVLKLGQASTVDIINEIKHRLPQIRKDTPQGLTITPIFDQSKFVLASRDAVLTEALLVAGLVAAVVLLFLGSLRSTVIVLISIPLALLTSVIGLTALGHTLNLMTLGGLGLAIGILVDNALVEIENINRNIDSGKSVRKAVIDSASQIVFPELVSTLSICIVLIPIFLLGGTSSYIFEPLALAVLLSMLASFILSRTLVPTLAFMLLPAERELRAIRTSPLQRFHHQIEEKLDRIIDRHTANIRKLMDYRGRILLLTLLLVAVTMVAAVSSLGKDYFPKSDAGAIRLHLRVGSGNRLEETAKKFANVQRLIREVIPVHELHTIVENIGPPDPINRTWINSMISASSEGELLIQLNPDHSPTEEYIRKIRQQLNIRYPTYDVLFRPADIISQTLNGTADSAIEINIKGRNIPENTQLASKLINELLSVDGAVDVMLGQIMAWPDLNISVDRIRAAQLGVSVTDISRAILVSLSSSASYFPNSWANNGISYIVAAQIPPHRLDSLNSLLNIPLKTFADDIVLLRNVVTVEERTQPAMFERQMLAPVVSILVNVEQRDLGGVYDDVVALTDKFSAELKLGNSISVDGQAKDMLNAYGELAAGMIIAALLVYLLMTINFQSWALPLVALSAMPLAITGALISLLVSQTPLSVSAFMGMIMVMGVTTANSVLVVSFARSEMLLKKSAKMAVIGALRTRFKPVIMTAIAMLMGMIPMALALGEGAEQNAPLARAVIGGLLLGTPATLTLVPLILSMRTKSLFNDAEESSLV
ncbi:efflux RND transporter permease subunit [Aliiglaciecola sp. LCG003]|uniref:efflux RND transporter permease subunit n=1 Tax=Aliiglaciecola sp. LCG003 TaxID=3053655 RepID=UPI002573A548|nr:efflux RND transporter permease subunit [Aliiglaciecola sp. LCG003]WJG10763.1 efflux RND transporter permease subunit [Aliiglaciecola sp. LCG003]